MKHNIVMTCEAKTPEALLLKRQIRKVHSCGAGGRGRGYAV